MLPRALTTDEKAAIRADGQWSELFLVIPKPATVYTARVNGAPASTDQLTEITYDGGAGTLADVLPGMTLFFGSTAGASDRGQARIRKDPDSDTFFIGTESEIDVQDNDYLTVVDEFGLWQRPVRAMSASEAYMDYDVAYSDQHTDRLPVVVLGGPAVAELIGTTADAHFDASGSWVPGGGAATYAWDAPTADGIDDDTAASVVITFSATGRHRVSCAVTIGGVTNTRYEYVYVLGDSFAPITQFRLGNLAGSKAEGGYSFGLTLYAEAALADVRDRAQVLLCERTFSAGQPLPLGYAIGRENILAVGWIAGETLEWSPDLASVTFQVEGAHAWLNRITAYPQGIEDTGGDTAASAWTNYSHLTVTAMMWHLLVWRSTVAQAIDCYVEDSDLRAVELSAVATTLWEQIGTIAGIRLLAAPCTDRLSRLFIQIDAQYRAEDARGDVADVLTLTVADWRLPLRITRAPVTDACQVDLNGVGYDGTNATAYFALAPGRTFRRFGRVRSQPSLLIADQAHANSLAGLVAGQANNLYPSLTLQLAGRADRFIDIAPNCYLTLLLAAGDTPRGVAFTKRLIPRRIDYSWDAATGMLLASVDGEAETVATLAVTGDSPPTEPVPPVSPCPGGYHYDYEAGMCVPDSDPPPNPGEGTGDIVIVATAASLGRTLNFLSVSPAWEDITGAITGTIVDVILDPFSPKFIAYCLTTDALWKCEDWQAASPTWTQMLTASEVNALGYSAVVFFNVSASIVSADADNCELWIGAGEGGTSGGDILALHTTDRWDTWDAATIATASGGTLHVQIQASNIVAGRGFALGVRNAEGIQAAYFSDDANASWTGTGWFAGVAFVQMWSFDVAYAGGEQTVALIKYDGFGDLSILRANAEHMISGPGGESPPASGPSVRRLVNIATHDQDDIMIMKPTSTGVKFLRSHDEGVSWDTPIVYADVNHGSATALGRWPYNPERVFFVTANDIFYSTDGAASFLEKLGNWAAVFGAYADGRAIVPVWVS